MILVIMGLSGSGKSFLSNILHQDFGFEWLRSDQIRKELAGLEASHKVKAGYGEGIYSKDWTVRVYEEMIKRAERKVREGKDVVLDATFVEDWQRELVRKAFPDVLFLLAWAEEKEVLKRLRERQDISDAGVEVYLRQKERFAPPDYAIRINTAKSREELRAVLREILLNHGWKGTARNGL